MRRRGEIRYRSADDESRMNRVLTRSECSSRLGADTAVRPRSYDLIERAWLRNMVGNAAVHQVAPDASG